MYHVYLHCHRVHGITLLFDLRGWTRPSKAPGLGVCKWSPEGLYDTSVSLIPNTDEMLKFVNKKRN